MSSTGRGGKRRPSDYYPTPSWCVFRLLEELFPAPEGLPGQVGLPYAGQWVEPCAGNGAIIRACQDWMDRCPHQWFDVGWTANELPGPDYREQHRALRAAGATETQLRDCLTWVPVAQRGRFDVCLTNPPYSQAEAFVRWGLANASTTIMLLRLGFLATAQRCELMRTYTPDVYVLPNRPSFTRGTPGTVGRTDSADYAWFVWRQPGMRRAGSIKVLRNTSIEERREGG